MPGMRAVSASTNVSSVGFGDSQCRSNRGNCYLRQSRLNFFGVSGFIEQRLFARQTPRSLCGFVPSLSFRVFLSRSWTLRDSASNLSEFDQLSLRYLPTALGTVLSPTGCSAAAGTDVFGMRCRRGIRDKYFSSAFASSALCEACRDSVFVAIW